MFPECSLKCSLNQVLERLEGLFSVCTSVVYEAEGGGGTNEPAG
jgi:hypothetical protein